MSDDDERFMLRCWSDDDWKRARQIAQEMIAAAETSRMDYFVLSDHGREPPPFVTQWQHKNRFGVTFNLKKERPKAEDWIATALIAGFTVGHSTRRCGWATGRGLVKTPYGSLD